MADADAKMQQYLLLAKNARGRSVAEIINKATSDPALFAFGELLDLPSVQEIQKGDQAPHFRLLEIFCYSTWPDYKEQSSQLPPVNAQQQLKLKQLTVVTLATKQKVIPYQSLMQQLDIPTVRELEDFIITECFYHNIVKGKLDQKQSNLKVSNVTGRDVRPAELAQLQQGLSSWLATSDDLLQQIQQRIVYASAQVEAAKKHREEVEKQQEEGKRNIKTELDVRGADAMLLDEGGFDLMDEDMARLPERLLETGRDRGDRTAGRPKSRRR